MRSPPFAFDLRQQFVEFARFEECCDVIIRMKPLLGVQ